MMSAGNSERLENTQLRDFCEQICRGYTSQFHSRGIEWSLDVDQALVAMLPPACLAQILNWCICDALDAMGQGGHLDLTVVTVAHGIEIEIADSRETFPSQASVRLLQHEGMRIDAVRCPQGGWARTVFVPDFAANYQAPYQTSRRAA